MSRKIPRFIGNIPIPGSRTVTIQLLKCWAELIDERKNIEPLFKELENTLPTHLFYSQAQEIAMHLGGVTDDNKEKFPIKCTSYIFVGEPKTVLASFNCKLAGLLHRYFDESDYKMKGPNKPLSQEDYLKMVEEAKKNEREDKAPCNDMKLPGVQAKEVPC